MLRVVKHFRDGGKEFLPGDPAPEGLNPHTIDLLLRTRHLVDDRDIAAPWPPREAGLIVHENPGDIPGVRVEPKQSQAEKTARTL